MLSLIAHFDAPEGYLGLFGWLCGYSADADFLDEAATRFTGQNASSRASQGRLALALMLDRHNRQITVPGVAHLPVLSDAPFSLLHAKVALLGFRKEDDPEEWHLRLLVSTGNWTRQTLEQSLDLIWRLDLTRNEINVEANTHGEDCADICAAWDFFKWLQRVCQTSLVTRAKWFGHENLELFQKWIQACAKNAKGNPRFFDNRQRSLLDQLVEKIAHGRQIRRNYLALGSGFYETVNNDENVMDVPRQILETLRGMKLLTQNPEMDLFVNPQRCQGVAAAFADLRACGFTIRPPHRNPNIFGNGCQRDLHAKFLFSAREMNDNNHCTNPWVYLGSGNLTHPGFTQGMNRENNLEAGVVFFPGNNVYWYRQEAPEGACVVSEILPLQWDDEIENSELLQAGEGLLPEDEDFAAPPLAWLSWQVLDGRQWLTSEEELPPEVEKLQVLDQGGQPCQKEKEGFIWKGQQPCQVRLRWKSAGLEAQAWIPVLDQYGRVAARELAPLDLAGVWGELADFPRPPAEEESEREEVDNEQDGRGQNHHAPGDEPRGPLHSALSSPMREMMELLENIAERQTSLPAGDWTMWCRCLEQTLCRSAGSEPVRYFREELKMNPLYPLYQASFRPDFAASSTSTESQFYEEHLHRIEEIWKVKELAPLGGNNAPEAREENA